MRRGAAAAAVLLAALAAVAALAAAEVYLEERFDAGWEGRWVESDWKKSDGTNGKLKLTAGKYYGDKDDKGVQTSEDYRFYTYTAETKPLDNEGKALVFQYQLKNEQFVDCGGFYFKLTPEAPGASMNGETPYSLMFGPDVCGTSTRKTHVILPYKGVNHQVKREVRAETDRLSHVYTLVLRPDNTYEVKIDGKSAQKGSLLDDFDMLPPRTIDDPSDSKPADWVDEKEIADPDDVKPAGWDDVPEFVVDPKAEKPEDWDNEDDGEWEAPTIRNPEFKGEWKPRTIPNPAYKGEWKARRIPNPDFVEDSKLYVRPVKAVSLEVWQVKSGSIFDNILLTDDEQYAETLLNETWGKQHTKEREMFDKQEEEKRKRDEEERKRMEEERKKRDDEEAKSKGGKPAASKSGSAGNDDDWDDDDDDDDDDHDDL